MSETFRPIVFTGPMATGKTAVGRSIAGRHKMDFIDTDRRIVVRHGPIPGIFASQGEEAFRSFEAGIVREVLTENAGRVVVSLGGGAVLDADTRSLLRDAHVVFLDADLATVLPRLRAGNSRPLLAGDAGEQSATLYEQRRPLYLEVADWVIDTRSSTLRQVVERVEQLLGLEPPTERRTTRNGH